MIVISPRSGGLNTPPRPKVQLGKMQMMAKHEADYRCWHNPAMGRYALVKLLGCATGTQQQLGLQMCIPTNASKLLCVLLQKLDCEIDEAVSLSRLGIEILAAALNHLECDVPHLVFQKAAPRVPQIKAMKSDLM